MSNTGWMSKGTSKVDYCKAMTLSDVLEPRCHYIATKTINIDDNYTSVTYRSYRTFAPITVKGTIICTFIDEQELIKWEASHGIHRA